MSADERDAVATLQQHPWVGCLEALGKHLEAMLLAREPPAEEQRQDSDVTLQALLFAPFPIRARTPSANTSAVPVSFG